MANLYFIAIVLPPELDEKILHYKHRMAEKYDCRVGLKSPAHITIIPPFWMEEEKEAQLIADLGQLSQLQPFPIATANFSAFPPRTIFVALSPNEALNELKKSVDSFFAGHPGYKIETETRGFHPHITIATRDLRKKFFQEAWGFYEDKKFQENWTAEGLSLLRHNKKNWDVVHTSQFKDL
jgi:2'-5' RNA ligase